MSTYMDMDSMLSFHFTLNTSIIIIIAFTSSNDLTWRDVQYITMMTSRPEPMRDGNWITNGVGRKGNVFIDFFKYKKKIMILSMPWDLKVWTTQW